MRCSKARDYVSQEIDAILPPDATGKLRDHLDSCADCQQFHEDLLMGQRLLAATEPELPENFEWKLQLKLNQALQQSAGESHYTWSDERVASLEDPARKIDAYSLVSARITLRPENGSWEVGLWSTNLLDEELFGEFGDNGDALGTLTGSRVPPRMVGADFIFSF